MFNLQLVLSQSRVEQISLVNEHLVRREMVRYTRALAKRQFAPGTAGNVSTRLSPNRILITPKGRSKSSIRAADLITVDMDGTHLAGSGAPSSEVTMHLEIYRHRPDVMAVIHAHPPIATAFACCGKAFDRILCQEAAMTLGKVPLAAYATTGTTQVAAHLVQHVVHHDAVLLANHGTVTYGSRLEKAFYNLEILEHIAHVHLVAHQLGSPVYLDAEQLATLERAKLAYESGITAINVSS